MTKIKVVTFSSREDKGLELLKRSMEQFNIDYHIIEGKWKGFGTKIIETYNYIKTLPKEYTHFLFVDAYDVLFLSDINEIIYKIENKDKLLISCEKACWPNAALSEKYPNNNSPWKYINSGSYLSPINLFIKLVDENPIEYKDDDQLWFTNVYLSGNENIELDSRCSIFFSIAFEQEGDYSIEDNRVCNHITNTYPIVIHANGRTNFEKIINLL